MGTCCRNGKPRTEPWKSRVKCTDPTPRLGYYPYGTGEISKANQLLRPKYRCAPNKPRGIHDYYNMMWDPHVYRGETFQTFQSVELERKNAKDKDEKRKLRKLPVRRLGGIEYPATPPRPPKLNVVDTDKFLIETVTPVEELDATTQTDAIDEKPPPLFVPAKTGYDVATEILCGEMFNMEEEIEPIVDTMGWKVLEQALLEVTEEEELRQLGKEKMKYEERRRLDAVRIKRLADREQQMHAEREALMEIYKKQMAEEQAAEERVGATQFSRSYLKELIPVCLENLGKDGFLHHADEAEIKEFFIPWLRDEVKHEIGQRLMAQTLLDGIIAHVSFEREAQIAASKWHHKGISYYDLQPEYEE